jgi:hypothetical protein
VDGTGSESCPVTSFSINGVETSCSSVILLVMCEVFTFKYMLCRAVIIIKIYISLQSDNLHDR